MIRTHSLNRWKVWMIARALLVIALMGGGLRLFFGQTPTVTAAGNATITLVIHTVHALDAIDTGGQPDFYAKATIGDYGQETTGWISDAYNITPEWTFSHQFERSTVTTVKIELWDRDGGFSGSDDHVDINPNPGRDLAFGVDTSTQGVKYQDTVPLEGVAQSGATIWTEAAGTENDRARIYFTITVTFDPPLRVDNRSGAEICYLYITPVNAREWGSDWLGSGTLPNGYYIDLYPASGRYHLRADYCAGGSIYQANVLLDSYTWTIE